MYKEESILSFFNPENTDCEAIDRFAIQLVSAYGAVQRSCITLLWACIKILLCNADAAVIETVQGLFQSKAPYIAVQESLCANPLLARYFAQSVLNYSICKVPWSLNLYGWSYLYVEAQLLCYHCSDEQVRRGVLSAIQQIRNNIWDYANERAQSLRIALNQALLLKNVFEEDDELCFRKVFENTTGTADTCLRLAVALVKANYFSSIETDAVIIENAARILGVEVSSVISADQLIEMMPEIFYETNVTCVNTSDITGMGIEHLPILAPFCNDESITDWNADRKLVNAAIPVVDAVIWAAYSLHMSQCKAWDRQSFFQIAAPDMDAKLCAPPKTPSELMCDVTADGVFAAFYDSDERIISISVPFSDPDKLSVDALVHSIELIQGQVTDWFTDQYLVFSNPTIVYPAYISKDEGQDICAAVQKIELSSIDAYYPQSKYLIAEYRHADHLLALAVAGNMALLESCIRLIIYVTPNETEAALIRIRTGDIWTEVTTIEEFLACSVRYEECAASEFDKLEQYIAAVSSRYPDITALVGNRGSNTGLIRDILQKYNISCEFLSEKDTIKSMIQGTSRIYSYNIEYDMLKIHRFSTEYPIEDDSDSI